MDEQQQLNDNRKSSFSPGKAKSQVVKSIQHEHDILHLQLAYLWLHFQLCFTCVHLT